MPLQREHLQFAFLFLTVPIQYFIVQQSGSSESTRTHQISTLINQVKETYNRWFKVDSWIKWLKSVLEIDIVNTNGECIAFEVLKYREKREKGAFASSTKPRTNRSKPEIKYRIGQVIKHKRWGYRAVIVGWDQQANAPEEWIKQMHNGHPEYRGQPNYSLLVDTRDRQAPQMTYVPEENIEVIKGTKILHPKVEDHFETYDGSQYIPRPWLRTLYPYD